MSLRQSLPAALRITACCVIAAGAGALPEAARAAAGGGAREPALIIAADSIASAEVVAIGRDLVVAGEALSDVAAVSGSVEVTGSVAGDVIVLGGGARLGPASRVEGDVFVLGGVLDAASGSHIGGRSVSYPTVHAAWLALLEGPTLGLDPFSPAVLGAKLALLAAWLGLTLLLFATAGREVISTSDAVREEPFRCFFLGLTGVLAMTLTALFFSAFAAASVGLPLLGLVVLSALLLKLWGMVAVFHALGDWVGRRVLRRRPRLLDAAVLGLVLLGGLKLVPWTGTWVWTVASLIGVGASLATKFGRRQPWFGAEQLEPSPARSRA